MKQANQSMCKKNNPGKRCVVVTGYAFLVILTGWISVTNADAPSVLTRDSRDRQILEKLSGSQLQEFDAKLREAMALYYENAFSLALPLFQEIAIKADTSDVLYWYGKTALGSGAQEIAIEKFSAILDRNPNMTDVYFDLAAAYVMKGDIDAAKTQLDKVKLISSSPETQHKIAQMEAALNQTDKQLFLTLFASMGIQSDSNINARSDDLPVGIVTQKLSGVGYPISANANLVYDFGDKKNFMWASNLNLYSIDHHSSSTSDYSQTDINTGLKYVDKTMQYTLPVGFVNRRYGYAELSESWYAAPNLSYRIKQDLDIMASYRIEDEAFDQLTNKPQDNTTHTLALKPSWMFPSEDKDSKQLTVAAIQGSVSKRNAATDPFSYEEFNITPMVYYRFDGGRDALLQGQFQMKNYDGNASLPGAPDQREDRRVAMMVMVKQSFWDHYVTVLSYTLDRNDSNTNIFQYTKHVVGLSLSTDWNF